MNSTRQRLSARDYKHGGRRREFELGNYRQFGAGLAVGLLVALAVLVIEHRDPPPEVKVAPKSGVDKEIPAQAPPEEPAEHYDFYKVLPKTGTAPAKQRETKKSPPPVKLSPPPAKVSPPPTP